MDKELREKHRLEFQKHFPETVGQHIQDYVTNVLLKHSRFIFTKRSVSGKHGCFCTHCKHKYMSPLLKHNDTATCPNCESICIVKASGRGRKKLSDHAYLVYYEKSECSSHAIIARGFYITRDYSGDYLKVETKYDCQAMYLFEPGRSVQYSPHYWNRAFEEFEVRSLHSQFSQWAIIDCPYESIAEAVKDTPFQFSTWEHYPARDMIQFFKHYSKYPCIEYLTKMGMRYFVEAKLYGGRTYGAINWNGTKINEVLKLSKQQLREIKESKIDLHPLTLRLQQIVGKEKSNISLPELQEIAKKYQHCFECIKRIVKYTTLRRTIAYIEKQVRKYPTECNGPTHAFISWKDYISDCNTLEVDLSQEWNLFPKNLMDAHRKTMELVEHKSDEILNSKIQKRAATLEKFNFSHENLFIRPVISADEIIQEGKSLMHCVGGYAKDYSAGRTNIFVIRQIKAPDKPFYTMEVKSGRIIQTQGFKHRSPDGEVQRFVDMFKSEKLDKPAKKNKSKNQGVAV
ncbi:PcfJ domain-containing protein [Paenibacillus sp. FSL R5-0517]|uniref:PcfJ domain-containing protein n=1 Tax=Paenibacillus sp. FSL R5-0517 TaxID=2921647 RepID=UPI0030D71C6B